MCTHAREYAAEKKHKRGEEASGPKGHLLTAPGTPESILKQPRAIFAVHLQQALWLTVKPSITVTLKVKGKVCCLVS